MEDLTVPGNLIAWLNRTKVKGDKRPMFNGDISLPNEPSKRPLSLWATTSTKNGAIILSGKVGFSAEEQIRENMRQVSAEAEMPADEFEQDAPIEEHELALDENPSETDLDKVDEQKDPAQMDIKPYDAVLFTNSQRDASSPNRPDYFGYYNPGEGKPLMRLAAWARTDRTGKAMLTGNVTLYERGTARDDQKKEITSDRGR